MNQWLVLVINLRLSRESSILQKCDQTGLQGDHIQYINCLAKICGERQNWKWIWFLEIDSKYTYLSSPLIPKRLCKRICLIANNLFNCGLVTQKWFQAFYPFGKLLEFFVQFGSFCWCQSSKRQIHDCFCLQFFQTSICSCFEIICVLSPELQAWLSILDEPWWQKYSEFFLLLSSGCMRVISDLG